MDMYGGPWVPMKKSYMKNLFSNFKNFFLKSYLKKTVIMAQECHYIFFPFVAQECHSPLTYLFWAIQVTSK
jgi:hypothetical protein